MPSYMTIAELPRPADIDDQVLTNVLVADSRVDQVRVRAAIDAVFAAHPALGACYEPFSDKWLCRPGRGWGWAVEPPGVAMADVIARQRASFDARTGKLFAVSLLPGSPDRLVLSASYLCMDNSSWQTVVEDLVAAYPELSARTSARA
jgi:hypothetical protein